MSKFVIIPQSDLDRLEEARQRLYKLFPNASISMLARISPISEPMWKLTHRRYPEIRLSNLPSIIWECLKREVRK